MKAVEVGDAYQGLRVCGPMQQALTVTKQLPQRSACVPTSLEPHFELPWISSFLNGC